jgi:hypothetical protein
VISRGRTAPAFETLLVNISSGGFYCYCPERYEPGEMLDCRIMLPVYGSDIAENALCLVCRARVVRIVPEGDHGYGIGCEIEEYRVMRTPGQEA